MLQHVLWIGGPPGSGKTTVTTRLARRHGLRWYNADTRTWVHRDRALAAGIVAAHRWETLPPEKRGDVLDEDLLAMSLHRERGAMVIDDLRGLPTSPLIVAEGSTLPASVVSSGITDRTRAVWLLPSDSFQRAQLETRGMPGGAVRLYLLFAEVIAGEAKEHGVPIFTVNGAKGISETTDAVEAICADALAIGPRAQTLEERQALLREGNEAIAEQVRGYYARPWAEGVASSVIQTFVCECGDPNCEASVDVAVAASGRPLLAHGHG